MKKRTLTLEHALYALALLAALGLRLLHLGRIPLGDIEAGWALQALQVAEGGRPAVGANPAYVHLTAVTFFLFDATNFLARFWGALAGSLLVLGAWFLRPRLGRIPALLLAFGLALDPALVALSRQAGGPMLAIAGLAAGLLLWREGRHSLAGVAAGLALLSGASVWFGALVLLLALTIQSWAAPRPRVDPQAQAPEAPSRLAWLHAPGLGAASASAGVTVLLLGSLLMLSPSGLPAVLGSLLDFLRGWWTLSATPLWRPFLTLPAYELLPLGFGIAGAVRGLLARDRQSVRFAVLALAGLLLVLLYPGKQAADMGWVVLPLWCLTAIELGRHLDFEGKNRWELAGVMTLVMVLVVFAWLELAAAISMGVTGELARMRLVLVGAALLLLILSLLLIGVGWSGAVARLGGVWGTVGMLSLFTLAMATGAAGIREPRTAELWAEEPRPGHLELVEKVANDISSLNAGLERSLPLTIVNLSSPALVWQFRDWQVETVTALPAGDTPELVITPFDGELSLAAEYGGEPLVLREVPDWASAGLTGWLKWFVYREMPMLREDLILWVRSDLMLDDPSITAGP